MKWLYLSAIFAFTILPGCASDSKRPVAGDGSIHFTDGPRPNTDGAIIQLLDSTLDNGSPPVDLRADRGSSPSDSTTPRDSTRDTTSRDTTVDTLPPPRYLERTLPYSGTGASQWLHIFFRGAGATTISARTLRINDSLDPPFGNVLTSNIPQGQCRAATNSGTLSDGRPFSTEIKYCFANDAVTVSHLATIDNVPPDPATTQAHGTASVDPYDATKPYERSLRFVGGGGSDWNHVARRAPGATNVDVETWSYNANLSPSTRRFTVLGIAPGACKNFVFQGSIVSPPQSFSTRVEYCRVGSQLEVSHTATVNGQTNPATEHGSIPIE